MECPFVVGQKVVCIATAERIAARMRILPDGKFPVSNGIYTVRELRDDVDLGCPGITVLLNEIDNRHLIGVRFDGGFGYREPGFPSERFRPLVTRESDISIFTAILNGHRIPEDA